MKNFKANYILIAAISCFFFSISCDNLTKLNPEDSMIELDNGSRIAKANDSGIVNKQQKYYMSIAEKLAVQYINEKDSTETAIPDKVVEYFYSGLIHLYLSNLNEAKEVTQEYRMTVTAPADAREVSIWTDESQPWLDNWRNEITKTGVAEIDELIDRFDLSLVQYRELSATLQQAIGTLRSTGPINTYAVGDLFSALSEVERAGPDRLLTGGRDVKATANKDFLLLDITVGSGGCPAGCINKINHQFKVFPEGKIEVVK